MLYSKEFVNSGHMWAICSCLCFQRRSANSTSDAAVQASIEALVEAPVEVVVDEPTPEPMEQPPLGSPTTFFHLPTLRGVANNAAF